jgi:hypothetical protein
MKKKDRYKLIKDVLNHGDYNFTVLNKTGDNWNHVRVKGFGDIWPGTGTYRIGDKYYKRDFNGLIQRLTGKLPKKKTSQQDIINELLKRVEDLEVEVVYLREHVLPNLT